MAIISVYQIRKWTVESGPLSNYVNVIIPKGTSVNSVAYRLADAQVIKRPLLFHLLARFNGMDKKLRAGEYQFEPNISMLAAMQKIAKGEVFYRKITFPEGLTTGQMLYMIASYDGLSGEISLDVAEGELLPETYSFEYGQNRDALVLQAKEAMQKALAVAWQNRNINVPLKNPQQLLTLASIVEKETGVPEERPLVASVFVNRLVKGMKLQTDPTVIYAQTEGQSDFGRSITKKDLKFESPYNTYLNYGLPPAPICNPGIEALNAAANPLESNYLYFVADGTGGHNFSKNLNDHNRNVQDWRNIQKK